MVVSVDSFPAGGERTLVNAETMRRTWNVRLGDDSKWTNIYSLKVYG